MLELRTDQFSYQRNYVREGQSTFTAGLSDLKLKSEFESMFVLIGAKTGQRKVFELFKLDKDSSGEDIYGWWYKAIDASLPIVVLIANDQQVRLAQSDVP